MDCFSSRLNLTSTRSAKLPGLKSLESIVGTLPGLPEFSSPKPGSSAGIFDVLSYLSKEGNSLKLTKTNCTLPAPPGVCISDSSETQVEVIEIEDSVKNEESPARKVEKILEEKEDSSDDDENQTIIRIPCDSLFPKKNRKKKDEKDTGKPEEKRPRGRPRLSEEEKKSPKKKIQTEGSNKGQNKGSKNATHSKNESSSESKSNEENKKRGKRLQLSFDNCKDSSEKDFLSSRCDVVYKTILRDFRRYFVSEFSKQQLIKSAQSKEQNYRLALETYTKELMEKNGLESVKMETLAFHIGCLIFPLDMKKYKVINQKGLNGNSSMVDKALQKDFLKVHDTMYKFSISKTTNLMKNWYYRYLFENYHEAIENQEIEMPDTMMKNLEVYQNAFRNLRGVQMTGYSDFPPIS